MDIIEFLKPKFVLMENVIDILRFANGCLARYAISRLVSMHYQARVGIMAAGCYGLPQFRLRVFLWGAQPLEASIIDPNLGTSGIPCDLDDFLFLLTRISWKWASSTMGFPVHVVLSYTPYIDYVKSMFLYVSTYSTFLLTGHHIMNYLMT